jgi:DNA-binding transcriptional LysR family regulator
MRRISLTNLETLCWIARLGTFTAAAQRLHTTQPTISGRIRELEQALGVSLFQRRGRKHELTIQGRELVQRAEPVLRNIEDIALSLENPQSASAIIRIGVGEIVAMSWFSSLLAELKRLMPKVVYDIEVDLNMLHQLELGKIDLAITAAPVDSQRFITAPLGHVEMLWVMAPRLKDSKQNMSVRSLLENFPLWSLSRPALVHAMTLQALHQHGAHPRNLNSCDHVMFLIEIAVSGGGIALLPECLIRPHLAAGGLVRAAPDLEPAQLEFVIACNKDQDQLLVRRIMALTREASKFPLSETKRLPKQERPASTRGSSAPAATAQFSSNRAAPPGNRRLKTSGSL